MAGRSETCRWRSGSCSRRAACERPAVEGRRTEEAAALLTRDANTPAFRLVPIGRSTALHDPDRRDRDGGVQPAGSITLRLDTGTERLLQKDGRRVTL